MQTFDTIILQFGEQGEKTGWRFVHIDAEMANELKLNNKNHSGLKECWMPFL